MRSSLDEIVLKTALEYDRNAGRWSAASSDRSAWAASYDLLARHVRAGCMVLDLGCGSGHDAPGLWARGFRLAGLDISVGLLKLARAQPALAGRLALGDIRSLPFASASFAGVWLDGSLHHIAKADVPAALLECVRVLTPGGIVCAAVERGRGEGFLHAGLSKFDAARSYALYEPAELSSAFETAALTVRELVESEPSISSDNGFLIAVGRKAR